MKPAVKIKPEEATRLVLESDSDDVCSDQELETFSGNKYMAGDAMFCSSNAKSCQMSYTAGLVS